MIDPPIDIHGLSSVERVNTFADCLHLGAVDLAICRKMTEAIERALTKEAIDLKLEPLSVFPMSQVAPPEEGAPIAALPPGPQKG